MKNEYVLAKKSNLHGRGVFAKKFVPKGSRIIEYVGEKVTKAESERRIEKIDEKAQKLGKPGIYFIFELNKRYDIDGDFAYNLAKWINHSCEPNCEPKNIRGHIWIVAKKDIQKGEELVYDYGFGFDKDTFRECPCYCGSRHCIGYIVSRDHWKKLEKHLKKK